MLATGYLAPPMSAKTRINLLPLFLTPGQTIELPIVIPGCTHVHLHELVYRNYREKDLIRRCIVHVNEQVVDYVKHAGNDKIYHVDGDPDAGRMIRLSEDDNLRFTLEVSCEDFSKCHCRKHKFQLNISALLEH